MFNLSCYDFSLLETAEVLELIILYIPIAYMSISGIFIEVLITVPKEI